MYHEPTSSSWLQAYRCLARQRPQAVPSCFVGYCLSVSFGRHVLDGPPQQWLCHPRRSWLVPVRQLDSRASSAVTVDPLSPSPWLTGHDPCFSTHSARVSPFQNSLTRTLGQPLLSPYIPSMPAGSDTACLQPGQHS